MTDGEVELVAAGADNRGGRLRGFVANRSTTQRLGAVAAVLIVLSAPFGGWRSASEQEVVPLELNQKIDIGPFYVTIEKVSQLGDLEPAASPQPGNRLLVIHVTVTNHTDRAEFGDMVRDAFSGKHTGAVPWPDQDVPELRIFDVNDAAELPFSEYVNPGQTYEWAMVLEQKADTDLDQLTLAVTGYFFRAEDPQTLDPDTWVLDDTPLAEGHVPIEVKE